MNQVTISVGPELFRFESLDDWALHAQKRFHEAHAHNYDTICVDAKGRVCTCGRDFRIAQETGAYPVNVYALEPQP